MNKKKMEIRVSGIDPKIWKEKRGKFLEKAYDKFTSLLDKIGDSELDSIAKTTLKEELNQLKNSGLSFMKNKLEAPAIENQMKLAEIQKTYAEIEKAKAETRKLNAESFDQELSNFVKTLKIGRVLFLSESSNDVAYIAFEKEFEKLEAGAKLLEEDL